MTAPARVATRKVACVLPEARCSIADSRSQKISSVFVTFVIFPYCEVCLFVSSYEGTHPKPKQPRMTRVQSASIRVHLRFLLAI